MASIKNVSIIGGAGALGPSIIAALKAGNFNVTVITRPDSKATFPASVKVIKADTTSTADLNSALQGQDALISAVGVSGFQGQTVYIDAAIAAGVHRFIPSEFGADISNPKAAAQPVFGHKVATRKYLEAKVAAGADITYTYVINGALLDWGLEHDFTFDLTSDKPKLFDGGNYVFSTTTVGSIGQAVAGVLSHPAETKNRTVYIQDIAISQKRLLELVRKVAPERNLTPVTTDLTEMQNSANEKLAKGEHSHAVMYAYILVAMFQDGYGNYFEKLDNELLGVKGKTEADIEEMIKKVLATKK